MEDFNTNMNLDPQLPDPLDPQLPDPSNPDGGFNNLLDPNLNYGKPGTPDMPTVNSDFAQEVADRGVHTTMGHQMRQEFDYKPIQEYLAPDIHEGWTNAVNIEVANMIQANAPFINASAIGGVSNTTGSKPGPAGVDWNPSGPTQSDQWDNFLGNVTVDEDQVQPDMLGDPMEFGIRSSNFERFYNHPNFQELGFNPYVDNDSYYNVNSSAWDDSLRMWPQFGQQFATGFTSIFRSIGDLFDDDPYFTAADIESATEMEDAMRIGMSTRGGVSGFMNNLTLNMGYTAGIVSEIALEELILWGAAALQGGLNPASDALAVGSAANAFRRFGQLVKGGFGFAKMGQTAKLLKAMTASQAAKAVWNTSKGIGKGAGKFFTPNTLYAMKYWRTTGKAAENLTNMAKVSRTAGAFYRDVRAVNLAVSESKLEGGLVYNERMSAGLAQWYAKPENKGKQPTSEDLQEIQINAANAASSTALWNIPFIFATNKLVLDGALTGFKPISRLMDESLSGWQRRVMRQAATKGGIPQKNIWKKISKGKLGGWLPSREMMKQWTIKGSMKRGAAGSLRYFAGNLGEGIQELYQEAVSHGIKDYYSAIFDDPAMAGSDAMLASAGEGIKSQMSAQGGEVFLSGFLMGGMIQGPQKLFFEGIPALYQMKFQEEKWNEYQKNKEDYIDLAVENLNNVHNNQVDNPDKFMDFDKMNFVAQKQAAEGMMKSAYENDVYGFYNHKDDLKYRALYSVLGEYKMKGYFKDQLKDYLKLDDQMLAQAFPGNQADIKNGKFRERIQDMIGQIDQHEEIVRKDMRQNKSPYDRTQFEEGTIEWKRELLRERAWEHARFLKLFTRNKWKRAGERIQEIDKELESHPVLSKLAANDLIALSDVETLDREIALLKEDIKLTKGETKKEKELLKSKTDKLRLLENVNKVLSDENNYNKTGDRRGHFNKKKINTLEKSVVKYLEYLAKEKNQNIEWGEVKGLIGLLVDRTNLKDDSLKYGRSVRFMENPKEFEKIVDKTFEFLEKRFKNAKSELRKRMKKYAAQQEGIGLIKAFENLNEGSGVIPTPEALDYFFKHEDASVFLQQTEDGTLVNLVTESGAINKESSPLAYNEIVRLVGQYNRAQGQTESESAEDMSMGDEFDVEYETDDTSEEATDDQVKKPKRKVEILKPQAEEVLNRKHKSHVSKTITEGGKKPLSPAGFRKSKEGQNIIKTFIRLEEKYQNYLNSVPEGQNQLQFEQWLASNETNPEIADIVHNAGLAFSDLSGKENPQNLPKDKLQPSDKEVKDYQIPGLHLIERTAESGDTTVTYYVILDENGDNTYNTYKGLSTAKTKINDTYTTLDNAKKAWRIIEKNMPDDIPFDFDGVKDLFHGAIVSNIKTNKKYVIISTFRGLKNGKQQGNKRLFLVPLESINDPKAKLPQQRGGKRVDLKEGQFKNKYELIDETFEPALTNTSKLSPNEFTTFYAWENKVASESKADAQMRMDYILNNLTNEELNNLEFQIILNKNVEPLKDFQIKQSKDGKTYEPNSQVKVGGERYSISLIATDPAVKEKIEKLLEDSKAFNKLSNGKFFNSDSIIAFYPAALQRKFYDSSGNEIQVPNMTSAQIRQIFRPSYSGTALYLDKSIKDGYAKQQYILEELLKAKEAGAVSVPVSNLDGGVILKSSPGRLAYVSKGSALVPLSELSNYSADDNGNVLILDNQRVDTNYTKKDLEQLEKDNPDTIYKVDNQGKVYKVAGNPISNLKGKALTKLYNEVKVGMGNYLNSAMAAGRYVAIIKLPNGVYTYAELQSQKLNEEEISDVLVDIKERATKTIKDNVVKEENEPWSDATVKDEFYNTKKSKTYPEGYNNELNKKFYIYSLPGYTVSMKVSSYGYVQIEFYNQKNSDKTFTIKINQDQISEMKPDIADFNALVGQIATDFITGNENLSKSQKQALETLVAGGTIFSTDNFRKSIDRKITNVDDIINNVDLKIDSRIRYDVGLLIDVTDSSVIQAQKTKDDITDTAVEEAEEAGSSIDLKDLQNQDPTIKLIDDLTDEEFNESRELGFEDISDEQLQAIADKDQNKLSSRESLVIKVLDGRYQPMIAVKAAEMSTAANKRTELQNKRKEVIDEIKLIKAENRAAAEELYPEDNVKMNKERMALNRKSKRIKALEKEKKSIESQLAKGALKVVSELAEVNNPEDLDVFIGWVQTVLPDFITIGDINTLRDRIITNGYTVGAFVMNLKQISGGIDINGTIFTGENMPSRYHEAFHAVFRMLLTEEEQKVYYDIAAKEVREKLRKEGKVFSEELEKLKNSSVIYSNLSTEQLKKEYYEEYMADEFEKFKKDPKSTKTNSLIKSLFNRFVEWIKSILGNKNRSELTSLFKAIDEGKYKNATIQNNAFTDKPSLMNGANIALAQIPIDFVEYEAYNPFSKQDETQYQTVYMPSRDVDKILHSMAAIYLNRRMNATGVWIGADQMEDIMDQFAIMFDPESEANLMKPDLEQMEDQLTLYNQAFENPITRTEIRIAVEKILGLADVQISEEEEVIDAQEETQGLRDTSQWDLDASMKGGYSSLASSLRQFIMTTAVETSDSFGNAQLPSGEKLIVPVNFVEAYNLLLKASANRTNSQDVLKAMNAFTLNGNHEGAAVVDRIFTEIGISRDDVLAGNFDNIKNPYFYTSVIKAFDQVRLDYIFVHRDEDGNVLLYDAASRDDAKSQFNHWNDAYDMQFDKLRFDSKLREEIIEKLRELQTEYFGESITSLNGKAADTLIQDSEEYSNFIQDKLGISLSPTYIQYSILDNVVTKTESQQALMDVYTAETLDFEDLEQIMLHLGLNQNLFVQEENEGIRGRLEKLARGNAAFDERVGASVFRNPNGDLVYAHQLPTMHTVKINQLNDINKLEDLKDGAYLERNALLNDPYFYQLATEKRIKVLRIAGSKEGGTIDEDTLVETRGMKSSTVSGVTYGDSSPQEFIVDLINVYTYFYNTNKKEVEGVSIGNDVPRALAPSLIRVIEASNQGDFIGLPVIKSVIKNEEGETAISEEALNKFVSELENEYNRIKRESNPDTATDDLIVGYNAREANGTIIPDESGRAFKLSNTGNLVSPKQARSIDRSRSVDEIYVAPEQAELLYNEENPTNLIIRTPATAIKLGIRSGETATVDITKKGKKTEQDQIEKFTLKSRGKITVDETNIDSIIKAFGSSVSTTEVEDWFDLKIGDKKWWVQNYKILQFLQGKKAMVAYDIVKGETAPVVEEVAEEIVEDNVNIEEGSEAIQQTKLSESQILEDLKTNLEEKAKEGKSFAQALNEIQGLNENMLKSLMEERLMEEFQDFRITLDEINATNSISSKILDGFFNENNKVGPLENDAMNALNLKTEDPDFNLMQVFFNDWLNSKSFNDLLLGDQALSLKDAVDKIKRAKAQNAAGYSAQTDIYNEDIDILHPVQNISLFTITDPKYKQLFDFGANRKGDKADAQMWMTIKAFQYMWFGFGKLNAKQNAIIQKLKRGEKLTSEDVFGNPETGAEGLKSFNAFINSKKLVYADGNTFLKMSAFVLTKELTSRKNSQGQWVAKENRKELHSLRENLESFEEREWNENGNGTLAIAAPMTASKMLKSSVINQEKLFSTGEALTVDQSTTLSAEWMRLQMINPSNKVIITDPTQMKSLVTSEQDDATEVWINGEKTDLGTIRKAYQKSTSNRAQLKFINQRNLLLDFNIETAMRELETSKIEGDFTVDLYSFLEYAIEGLEASQSSASIIEYFRQDADGQSRNLNNPITIDKFEQLFLSYFSKQVFREKIPGHKVSLLSGKGFKVYRKVLSVDENGQPERSEIIRDDQWEAMSENERPPLFRTEYDNVEDKTFVGLEQALNDNIKGGVVVLDELRFNVKEFDENGNETGQRYAEYIMPPHFKSIMDKVIATGGETITASEIQKKWKAWSNTKSFSPKANDYIVRSEIEGFDANRSKKEYGAAFGYTTTTNKKGDVVFLPKNGKGLAKIPEAIAKAFGVRIPSQDMHSSINLKLVDFMPAYYGSTGVFPDQLIEVSGADFDIDALYMQIKDFYEDGNSFKSYGSATTKIGKYREYVDYQMNDAYKGGSSLHAAREKYLAKGVNRNTSLTDKQKAKAKEAGLTDDVIGALMVLGLPITQKEYEAYKEKRSYTVGRGENKMEFKAEPYEAPMNNDVLDQKFALLGNEAMTLTKDGRQVPIAYESAVLDPLIKEWNWIQEELPELAELVQEEDVDVDNLNGKLKAWTNNKEGARSIGAAVLPNVIVNLLAEAKVKYRSVKVDNRETYPQIRYNGVTFNEFGTELEIDPQTKKEKVGGERTQFVISALITAMTDNAKERLAAKLGLNKDALATVVNLTALGVPIRTSILLINNPMIKRFYWENSNKENPEDAGIFKRVKDQLSGPGGLEDIYANLYGKDLATDAKLEVTDEKLMEAIQEMKSFNSDERTQGTMFTSTNAESRRYTKSMFHRDYVILKQWQNAHRLKKFTGEMQDIVNLAKTLGQNFQNVQDRNNSIENLGLFYEGPYSSLTMSDITNEPIGLPLENGWQKIFKGDDATFHGNNVNMDRQLQQLLPKIFLSKTDKFQDILNTTLSNMNPRIISDRYEGSKIYNKVSTDLISYITIKAYIQGLRKAGKPVSLASLNNGLIYKENGSPVQIDDVIDRLRKVYEGKENYFLNRFIFNDSEYKSTNTTGTNQLKATTWTKISPAQVEKIQNGFADIFSNIDTRADAIHIAHYLMVRDALQFKSGSILAAMAPFIYDLYLDYVDIAHEAFQIKEDNQAFTDIFGMSHKEMIKDFTLGYLKANPINWMLNTVGNSGRAKGRNIGVYAPGENKYQIGSFKIENVEADQDNAYVFSESQGYKGNAKIKDLDNAFGIQFKKDAGITEESYFTNDDLADFQELIDAQIDAILDDGRNVIFPRTFLSKTEKTNIAKYGPEIFNYMQQRMQDVFNYNIKTNDITAEGKISEKAAANRPALILETEEGNGLIVDVYNNVIARPSEAKSQNEINERFYSNPSKKSNKQVSINLSVLSRTFGFKTVNVDTKHGLRSEVIFPAELRVKEMVAEKNEDGRLIKTPFIRTFELKKIWSGTKTGSTELLTTNQPLAIGNRAEYIETTPVGSNQATPIAFSFDGEVPTYENIRRGVLEREEGDNDSGESNPFSAGVIGNKRFITKEDLAKEQAVQNGNVKADENGILVDNENIADINKEKEISESELEDDGPSEDVVTDPTDSGPSIDISTLGYKFSGSVDESFVLIDNFIETEIKSKSKAEQSELWKKMKESSEGKIRDEESAKEAYQDSAFESEEEFIDYLKKCII